jgi:methylglutaconyl-CoA hydratase
MPDETKLVLYEIDGAVARITLNRPEKRNALNEPLIDELKAALRTAGKDDSIRAVVLSGAGPDFCAGADLAALQRIATASVVDNLTDAHSLLELFTVIRHLRIPVIAAVRGRALAGGCGLATSCDLLVAAGTARFGYPEVKIGFVPAMVMAILRRNISEKEAFAMLTRGAEISAEEARYLGLVNQVFADDGFEAGVANYARAFEKLSATAVALTKTLLYQTDGMAFLEALETGADLNVITRMTKDCQEGISRFLSKS